MTENFNFPKVGQSSGRDLPARKSPLLRGVAPKGMRCLVLGKNMSLLVHLYHGETGSHLQEKHSSILYKKQCGF